MNVSKYIIPFIIGLLSAVVLVSVFVPSEDDSLGRLSNVNNPMWRLSGGSLKPAVSSWGLGVGVYDLTDLKAIANGSIAESFNALVSSDGSIITVSLEQSGGGDLTLHFSDGHSTIDATPATTTTLTAGSDASPQANYLYITKANKYLEVSTSAWPDSEEHTKVAYFLCPSAALVQTNGGCYINQNWNDHLFDTDNMGHLAHIAERSRLDGAYYFSGIDPNGTTGYLTISGSTVYLKSTSGVIFQMHKHAFPAFDSSAGDEILVVNWNGDNYHNITNLNDITADADGDSTANKYINLVLWGVANQSGDGYEPLMINLPTCSYTALASALDDVDGCDVYSIPREFDIDSSTGFLITRITVRDTTTWSHESALDLRGLNEVAAASGGATGAPTDFADNQFTIFDESDSTKVANFQASGITTGTTRTYTFPDANGTLALLTSNNWTGTQDFGGATVEGMQYYPSFTYATTTWTGSTTIPLGPAYVAQTWAGVKCFTDTGTLFVEFTDGTNVMNDFQASTTVGTITLSSNNSFTAGEKRYVEIGTASSSPTEISCTVNYQDD